jgi:hypothetical protein
MRWGKDLNCHVVAVVRSDMRIGHRASEDVHWQPPFGRAIGGAIGKLVGI